MRVTICKRSTFVGGLAVIVMAASTIPTSLRAATLTWVGNTSGNLLEAGNWAPTQEPVNGDTWFFGASGSAGTSLTLGSSRNINGLFFSGSGSAYTFGGAGTYTIATGGLGNSSGTTQTFNSNVRYNTSSTLTANPSSPLVFNGNFYGSAIIDLSSTVTFNGNIAGPFSTGLTFRFGAGVANINGASNTSLQTITINRGQRVNIGSATGLASVTTVTMGGDQSNATLANTSGTPLTTGASLATAAASRDFIFGDAAHTAANSMSFTGTAAINADVTRTIGLNGTGLAVTSASIWNNTVTGNRTLTISGAGNTFGIGGIAVGAAGETNNVVLTISGNGNLAIAGGVTAGAGTGTRGLTINKTSGAGTVTIGGTSDYTGATSIQSGTLQIGAGGNTGSLSTSSAITVSSNATLAFNRSNTLTQGTDFNAVIAGAGNLVQAGAGTLILNGANTYTGATSIRSGTLQIGAGGSTGSLSTSSAITVSSGATLAFNRSNTLTQGTDFNAVITGGGNLVQAGAGTLILNGANTYTGATTISAGVLALGANGSFANSSTITVGDAGSSNAALDLTAKTAAFALGAGQTLSGGGTALVAPGQQFEVQGTFAPGNSPGLFTFDGGTTVLAGTTVMEIFGTSRATSPSHGSGFYDAVNIVDNGVLQLGGMLTLEFSSLFDNATAFDLFSPASGSSLAGTFSGVSVIGSFYTGLSWSQTGSTWKSSNTVAGQSLEFNATSGQLVIVPEPAGFVLATAGVLIVSVGFSRRRRR